MKLCNSCHRFIQKDHQCPFCSAEQESQCSTPSSSDVQERPPAHRPPTWIRYLNATAASFVLTACYGMPGDYMYFDTASSKADFIVGDTGNPTIKDLDNDGASFMDDCDDNDPDIGSIAYDADCDQILSIIDCDDNDPTNRNSNEDDSDCDGVATADDCDDDEPMLGAQSSDSDCDGDPNESDCDDENAEIYTDAIEYCDGIDNNCDSLVDGIDPNASEPVEECQPPENTDEENTDEENTDEENTDEENTDEENTDEENTDEENTDEENTDEENTDNGGS